ncbi:ankyrin-2-like [Lineus longissimus]|uniref:ankyrin-2-like n=1 Tax=Lineus longissimus TaxID=88925 RepID=UPI002B4DB36C
MIVQRDILTSFYTFLEGLEFTRPSEDTQDPNELLILALIMEDLGLFKRRWTPAAKLYKHSGNGFNFLHIAVVRGSIEIIRFLLNEGMDLNDNAKGISKDACYSDLSCLHLAVTEKSKDVVLLLLRSGCYTECHLRVNRQEVVPASAATGTESEKEKKEYKGTEKKDGKEEEKEDVSKKEPHILSGMTPLHFSALLSHLDIIQLLIDHRAIINAATDHGFMCLHLASIHNFGDLAEMLLTKRILKEVRAKDGATPLFLAASHGAVKVLNILIAAGCSVNAQISRGITALHSAAQRGYVEIINILCAAGCDIDPIADFVDKNDEVVLAGTTPLHVATASGKRYCVEALLKHGADPNLKYTSKEHGKDITSFHLAINKQSEIICRILLKYGGDINAQNGEGFTPLMLSVYEKNMHLSKFILKQQGVDVNIALPSGATALVSALYQDSKEFVELILKEPAIDIEQTFSWMDIAGQKQSDVTPLHLAVGKGMKDMVEILLKHGADVNTKMSQNDGTDLNVSLMHTISNCKHHHLRDILYDAGCPIDSESTKGITPLMIAALYGDTEHFKFLVERGANINKRDNTNQTSLMQLAKKGSAGLIRYLVEKGCELDVQDDQGYTALHWAISYGENQIAHFLVDSGCDVNLVSKKVLHRDNLTPLILAIEYCRVDVIEKLLSKGAHATTCYMRDLTPLHLAAQLNKVEMMSVMIKYGADIDAKSTEGETPLHFALLFESPGAAKHLVKAGCDLRTKAKISTILDEMGLHLAIQREYTDVIDLVADFGSELHESIVVNNVTGVTPLHLACVDNKTESLKKVIGLGADINQRRGDDFTALLSAATKGNEDSVKLLLEHGADVHPTVTVNNCSDVRPLDMAGQNGFLEVIKLLIQGGANVMDGLRNGSRPGILPLFSAAENGYFEVVKYFINFGVDVNAQEDGGLSALHYASIGGHEEIVEYLLNSGADPNLRGKYNDRADMASLHCAAENGHMDICDKLIVAGADINAVCIRDDKGGNTATMVATLEDQPEVLVLLSLGYGGDVNIQTKTGLAPLHVAVQNGSKEAFEILLLAGCETNIKTNQGITALILAAEHGHVEMARALIASGCDVQASCTVVDSADVESYNVTAIHQAAEFGHVKILKMLIHAGASVNITQSYEGRSGITPLHCAALTGKADVVPILIEAKCDINAQTAEGLSALHLAVKGGYMETAKTLIDLDINPTLKSKAGEIASAFAHSTELTRMLLNYEAAWKLKHQRPNLKKKRMSLHQRMSLAQIEVFSTKDFVDSTDQGGRENLGGQAEEGEGQEAAPVPPPQPPAAPPAAAGGGSAGSPRGGGQSQPEVPLNMPISGS